VKTVKFLGMTFDQELNWNAHIENILRNSKGKINLLRSLTGYRWGASKKTLIRIYDTLIKPKLDYGIEIMHTASKKSTDKLEKIENMCLRICCGAMKSTPIDALHNECGELPFQLRRKAALLKYSVKIANAETNPASEVLQDCWEIHYGIYKSGTEPIYLQTKSIIDDIKSRLDVIKISTIPPWKRTIIDIDTEIAYKITKNVSIESQQAVALEKIHEYQDCLQIYTDAAKLINGSTGCSYYIPASKTERKHRINSATSINTAELIAIDAVSYTHLTLPTIYSV